LPSRPFNRKRKKGKGLKSSAGSIGKKKKTTVFPSTSEKKKAFAPGEEKKANIPLSRRRGKRGRKNQGSPFLDRNKIAKGVHYREKKGSQPIPISRGGGKKDRFFCDNGREKKKEPAANE